jgi:hypothetical protein
VNCHVLCVSPTESEYTQAYYKFTYFGHTLPTTFLDGDASSWAAWQDGTGYPQSVVVGANDIVYYHATGYYSAGICEAIERTYYNDYDAPYVDDLDPEDGETDVALDTDIEATIVDDGYGIDEASVVVVVTTSAGDTPSGDLSFNGDILELDYSFDPNDPLPHFVEVTVTASADDLYDPPNEMSEYSYSFWTRSFDLNEPDDGDVIDVTGPRSGGGEAVRPATGNTLVVAADDGRTGVDVTFEWEEVVRANSYELLVDDNDDFSSPEVNETGITDTEYTHTFDVTDDVTYYWYVICNAPDSDFDSADVFSFEFDYNTNLTPASLGSIKAGFAE